MIITVIVNNTIVIVIINMVIIIIIIIIEGGMIMIHLAKVLSREHWGQQAWQRLDRVKHRDRISPRRSLAGDG